MLNSASRSLIQDIYRVNHPVAKVLGICGSPRKGGNSDVLLQQVFKGVQKLRVPAAPIYLRDMDFRGCIGCERCRVDKICTGLLDAMTALYSTCYASQGLVLVCPTHNYNITAWMKAFIDRLYCFYDFDTNRPRGWGSRLADQGRKAAIIAVCEQVDSSDMGVTLEAMRRPLEALGYAVVAELPVFGVFDAGKVQEQERVMMRGEQIGEELATALAP